MLIINRKFVKIPIFNWSGYENTSDLSNDAISFSDDLNILRNPYTYTQDHLTDLLSFSFPDVAIGEYYVNRSTSPVPISNRIGVVDSSITVKVSS